MRVHLLTTAHSHPQTHARCSANASSRPIEPELAWPERYPLMKFYFARRKNTIFLSFLETVKKGMLQSRDGPGRQLFEPTRLNTASALAPGWPNIPGRMQSGVGRNWISSRTGVLRASAGSQPLRVRNNQRISVIFFQMPRRSAPSIEAPAIPTRPRPRIACRRSAVISALNDPDRATRYRRDRAAAGNHARDTGPRRALGWR